MRTNNAFESAIGETADMDVGTNIIPFEAVSGRARALIRELPLRRHRNQAVSQIVSDRHYVDVRCGVLELADALIRSDSIQAVGVVNSQGRAVGLVIKRDFFSFLSRPFVRDVMKYRDISEVMTKPEIIHGDRNIFTVAEELREVLKCPGIRFYVLVDDLGGFRGVFTSKDMLIFLSDITQRDIELARKMQTRLVQESELAVGPSFESAASSISAKGIGGDYYSLKRITDRKWIGTVCDVSGKGIAASIITSVLWGMMNFYDFRRGLRRFISQLNAYLYRIFDSEKFVTGIFFEYDEADGTMRLCDMGHSYAFVFRKGKLHALSAKIRDVPVGVLPECTPRICRLAPEPGDILFLITDGLVDQENVEGERYSFGRIARIFRERSAEPVEAIRRALENDFHRFRGTHHLNDDVTFLIMKFGQQDLVL